MRFSSPDRAARWQAIEQGSQQKVETKRSAGIWSRGGELVVRLRAGVSKTKRSKRAGAEALRVRGADAGWRGVRGVPYEVIQK